MGRLVYELDGILKAWKIHPVVIIAQLELVLDNSFQRTKPPPPLIIFEGDKEPEYEIERILKHKVHPKKRKGKNRRFLIRWKGYDSRHD